MAFEVPPLPYDYGALEPHIDEQTMRLHHDKHHQAYVDNANKALEGTALADKPVEHVLTNLEVLPEDKQTLVKNNAGGHSNHSMFWEIMSPDGGGEPSGPLADAINDLWGSVADLKQLVNETGVKRFGSGWTWLVHDGTGLAVYSTANQDSPILSDDFPCSATTSGSTPTTSSTRTGDRTTSRRGGTSSTGTRSPRATSRRSPCRRARTRRGARCWKR